MPETFHAQPPKRLETYPERFRARVAGRVERIHISHREANPRFEVILLVGRSKPLPPAKTHPLTGMPIAETGEDLDDTFDISAEDENNGQMPAVESDAGFGTRYSVTKTVPRVLYPDFAPLVPGTRVRLIWLGQQQVPGIVAGGYLRVSGMLSTRDEPVIYNPRYEIVPSLED